VREVSPIACDGPEGSTTFGAISVFTGTALATDDAHSHPPKVLPPLLRRCALVVNYCWGSGAGWSACWVLGTAL